ncbi:serine/threonine receptor-like kinase NFP [Ananas comosus]|uniref:Serine/threonine receptor-like kinase NFP n=1 Tax=Ananas comosus TaxID=4615 RepID=A0A6P5F3W1_ANACO|nr:serine/threonine receptor-like kinase NFP [Ananas comosus]
MVVSKMKQSLLTLLFSSCFIYPLINAQSTNTNTTTFSCSSISPCRTYVAYRTQLPNYADIGAISDLFGVSRLSIAKANNLSSEDGTLLPDQLLLVPVSCGCTANRSFANMTYEIAKGDSFYLVSIRAFENLTDYNAVEEFNPSLDPSHLKVGQEVIFPLYCKCPSKIQVDQSINFLLTYVWQASDQIDQVSKLMNSSTNAMLSENNYRNFNNSVARPVLIPVSELPRLPTPIYDTTTHVSQQNARSDRTTIVAWSMVGVILALVILGVLACYCKDHHNKVFTCNRSEVTDLLGFSKTSDNLAFSPAIKGDKLLTGVSQFIDKPVFFDNMSLAEATMNFDDSYRIGSSVYKAEIGGEVYAVKKAKGEVAEELKILQFVSHANLVKLEGVSSDENGDCFLIYEFAENGSLDKWLFRSPSSSSSSSSAFLSWKQRLSILLDVASGLQYLHEHTRPSIVHGDVRARNILLSADFKAKISKFSAARMVAGGATASADVFAFGILILEVISGRRAMESGEGGNMRMLWEEIRTVLEAEEMREHRIKKWMDPSLEGFYPTDGAISIAVLARACAQENYCQRPSMTEIVFSLSVLDQLCSCPFDRASMPNSEENTPVKAAIASR